MYHNSGGRCNQDICAPVLLAPSRLSASLKALAISFYSVLNFASRLEDLSLENSQQLEQSLRDNLYFWT